MLDTLYSQPAVLARFRAAPLAEERARYLRICADRGHNRVGLRKISWLLLVIVTHVPLNQKTIDVATITLAAKRHKIRFKHARGGHLRCASSQRVFVGTAKRFFQFIGRLAEPVRRPTPCEPCVIPYQRFLLEERGLSLVTVESRCQHARDFLQSVRPPPSSLKAITVDHVDRYLIAQSKSWSRPSLATLTSSLRCFFRFAEAQRWCRPGMAAAIDSPRMYSSEGVPCSPTWDEVQKLIAHATGDEPAQIRDLAVILLLAVYGLRRGEVARLRLDDIDWQAETLRVYRSKQRRTQQLPLARGVGEAIIRYLREERPRCAHRELFLALRPPVRPLSASSISALVRWRLRALGVELPHIGAHCLRHACARHLLARGFSLKEIGDQLGHRRTAATMIYAKVDLEGLRQVAELDLGRLI